MYANCQLLSKPFFFFFRARGKTLLIRGLSNLQSVEGGQWESAYACVCVCVHVCACATMMRAPVAHSFTPGMFNFVITSLPLSSEHFHCWYVYSFMVRNADSSTNENKRKFQKRSGISFSALLISNQQRQLSMMWLRLQDYVFFLFFFFLKKLCVMTGQFWIEKWQHLLRTE